MIRWQGCTGRRSHWIENKKCCRCARSTIMVNNTTIVTFDLCPQATAPVSIPSSSSNSAGSASTSFTPTNSSSFSISWQSPPVTFTGNTVRKLECTCRDGADVVKFGIFYNDRCVCPPQVSPSKSQGFSEQRSQTIAVLSSPPRATTALRYAFSLLTES